MSERNFGLPALKDSHPNSGTTGNLRPADRGREDTREMNLKYGFRIPKGGPWARMTETTLFAGQNYIIKRVWRSASMEGEVPAKGCLLADWNRCMKYMMCVRDVFVYCLHPVCGASVYNA